MVVNNMSGKTFIVSHLVIPLLVITPILIGFELTNWDVDFQNFFYIAQNNTWLVDSKKGWIEIYLHDGGKTLTHIYADLAILGLVLSYIKKPFKPFRMDFIFIIVAIILATGVVSALKHETNIYCPNKLTLFGGDVPYVKIFESRIAGYNRGICWPSGHASAGYAFVSAYFVVRRYWPRYAWVALVGGLGMGVLYGSVRMVQGLHFLSHTLWAGVVCWVVIVLLAMVFFKENRPIGISQFVRKLIP